LGDRPGFYHVIEKHVAGDIGYARCPGALSRHGFIGGSAVEKEQSLGMNLFHQPGHRRGAFGEQAAGVIADADGVRHPRE
jgi:hypothetical protein